MTSNKPPSVSIMSTPGPKKTSGDAPNQDPRKSEKHTSKSVEGGQAERGSKDQDQELQGRKSEHPEHVLFKDLDNGDGGEKKKSDDDGKRPPEKRFSRLYSLLLEVADPKDVDITGLIYFPQQKEVDRHIEKTSGVGQWVDLIFTLCSFCNLICCSYYLLIGLTIFSFTTSIRSIALDPEDQSTINHFILHTLEQISPENVTVIIVLGFVVLPIINIFSGLLSVVQGYKNTLIAHMIICGLFQLFELIFFLLTANDTHCKKDQLNNVHMKMYTYIRSHGTSPPLSSNERQMFETSAFQLDSIQVGLQCCGALSWADYLDPNVLQDGNGSAFHVPASFEVDGVESVFPSSCCTPWWVRNVHCARGAHLWAHPSVDNATALKFRTRINQTGCMLRIKNGCERINQMIFYGFIICAVVDLALLFIKLVCFIKIMQNMMKIIRMKKEAINADVEDGDDIVEKVAEGSISMPNEDEIELIKSRSDFNKFEAKIKRTIVGKWIRDSRKSVTLPHNVELGKERRTFLGFFSAQPGMMSLQTDDRLLDAEQVLQIEIEKQIQLKKEREERERLQQQVNTRHGKMTRAKKKGQSHDRKHD